MTEYWQDKRINHRHVACAWALVLVIVAVMFAITFLDAPECPHPGDAPPSACATGMVAHTAVAKRQPRSSEE